MTIRDPERRIRVETVVPASIDSVWDAWTTEDGIRSFLAPACHVEARIDGPYEIYFAPELPPGQRGSEGMRILAMQPPHLLSFTWNAPPHLPNIRGQRTAVVVRLAAEDEEHTHVSLIHTGWGEGDDWDAAFRYFERAWGQVVLPRLRHRHAHGPIDWENPPSQGAKGSSPPPGPSVTIRLATAGDFDGVGRVFAQENAHHAHLLPDRFRIADPIMTPEWYADVLADANTALFVAEGETGIVGLLMAASHKSGNDPIEQPRVTVYVEEVAVLASHRGHGIGRQLMEQAARWAEARGASSVELDVWEANESARAFYKALGYEMIRRRMARQL